MSAGIPIVVTDDLKPQDDSVIEGHLYLVIDGKRLRVVPFGVQQEIDQLKDRVTATEAKLPKG